MLLRSIALKHYKKREIQEAIVKHAKQKEIAIRYGDKGFGARPDTLSYPNDVMIAAKNGATSFHSSEELWITPTQIDTSMSNQRLNKLRNGWDLVLDIDCPVFEYSRQGTDLLVKALQFYNVQPSVKFSGNKGFHIGVPFEAFPETITGTPTKELFPEGPRAIALYLRDMIEEGLSKRLLSKHKLEQIAKNIGKKPSEIIKREKTKSGFYKQKLRVESILVIDTILIASRHLYRMPYSLHEKSHLVSIPIDPEKTLEFKKDAAKPEKVKISDFVFMDRKAGNARQLLTESLDYRAKVYEAPKINKHIEVPEEAIPEKFFPPCMMIGLDGLKDGRKRFLFCLMNFLQSAGWSYEQIETKVREWNKKNPEPLKENTIKTQLSYRKRRKQAIPPPNCQHLLYYVDIGICKPDNFCKRIKNPLQYAKRKTNQ